MSAVIDFSPDGQVQAMHRDGFDLGFLGERSITRASDIKFNETTQSWDIWLMAKGRNEWLSSNAQGFAGYDIARKVEVRWLDESRLEGVPPSSSRGCEILAQVRTSMGA